MNATHLPTREQLTALAEAAKLVLTDLSPSSQGFREINQVMRSRAVACKGWPRGNAVIEGCLAIRMAYEWTVSGEQPAYKVREALVKGLEALEGVLGT